MPYIGITFVENKVWVTENERQERVGSKAYGGGMKVERAAGWVRQ